LPWAFKEDSGYELLDLTRWRADRRQRNSETYFCLRLQNEIPLKGRGNTSGDVTEWTAKSA